MKRLLVALLVAAAMSGCAGTQFKFDNARQVRVGMTERELTALMGKPYAVATRGDEQLWTWSEANAFGNARSVSFVLRNGAVVAVPKIPETFE